VTIFYPDVSGWNGRIPLNGAAAVCAKSTEDTSYLNPDYGYAAAAAAAQGSLFFAYHMLHAGDAAAQAAWCHANTGAVPLMIDTEATEGSQPGVADVLGFTGAYRAAGGTVHLVYLPGWYWRDIGSPSLAPLAAAGLHLVSSLYGAPYADDGPGWAPYGGMAPVIWQYTNSQDFGGQQVDFNAYRGTLTQLTALIHGVSPAAPPGPAQPAWAGSLNGDDMSGVLLPKGTPTPLTIPGWPSVPAGIRFTTVDGTEGTFTTGLLSVNWHGSSRPVSVAVNPDGTWPVIPIPEGEGGASIWRLDDNPNNVGWAFVSTAQLPAA